MTTTFTLTERYISATIRSLRPDAQADVRAELEASIADAIEARVEQGRHRSRQSAQCSRNSATRESWPQATRIARSTSSGRAST